MIVDLARDLVGPGEAVARPAARRLGLPPG
jgi:hypothetical protein